MHIKNLFDHVNGNEYFRQVLATNTHSQLVLMCLQQGEEIGEEVHQVDQILIFTQGTGKAILDGVETEVSAGDAVNVPAGTRHNFINTGSEKIKLVTIYAPAEHADGTVHKTKAEADEAETHE